MGRYRAETVIPSDTLRRLGDLFPNLRTTLHPVPFRDIPHLHTVETEGQTWLIKEHWFLTDDRLAVYHDVMEALLKAGLCPPAHRSAGGRTLETIDGRHYSVTLLMDEKPFEPTIHCEEAARKIAALHSILAEIEAPVLRSPIWAETEQVSRELTKLERPDLAKIVMAAKREAGKVRWQLVHNDLHARNILVTPTDIFIIDPDSFSTNPVVADAFFAALRLGNGKPDLMHLFLDAYRREFPLDNIEAALGSRFLIADLAHKYAFIFRRRDAGDDRFLKDALKYERLIRLAMSLDPRARQD